MRNSTEINFSGNLTDAPEIRFAPSGTAVARFTVAVNPRTFDRAANEWKDGEAAFYRCSAFGALAEHLGDSLVKGDRVMVFGRLEYRTWKDEKTNETRGAFQVSVDEIGASLSWATVKTSRTGSRRADDVPPSDEWANASRTRPTVPAANGSGEPPF